MVTWWLLYILKMNGKTAMRLTEKRIRDLTPALNQRFVWDQELSGFGIRVGPTGSKSFIIQYRVLGGRDSTQRRYTIAKCEKLSLEDARILARKYMMDARLGKDPFDNKNRLKVEPECCDLFERYINEHAKQNKSKKSAIEDERYIRKFINPQIGSIKLKSLNLIHIEKLHKSLKSTPTQANRVLAVVSMALTLAERWRLREVRSNPCYVIQRFTEVSRNRYFSENEVKSIGLAIKQLEESSNPYAILALRLAFLLGLRIGEVQNIQWDDVNFETEQLSLKTKTGPRTISVPPSALELISASINTSSFIIAGRKTNRPLDYKVIHKVWKKICGIASLENARIHDIRHTTATIAAETGAGAHLIRDLIGHKTLAMANLYVGRMNEPVRDLRKRVSDQLSEGLGIELKKKPI